MDDFTKDCVATGLVGVLRGCFGNGLNQRIAMTQGFTLIELMVTLSVAAVLLTVGVPSFQEFIASNRLTSEINSFTAYLNLARSEAIKSGGRVTLCASSNGTSCATSGGWEQGYLIYRDINGNGSMDTGTPADPVLRVGAPMRGNITLRGETSDVARSLSFMPSGQVTSLTAMSRQLVGCDDRSKTFASAVRSKARVIVIKKLGSSGSVKGDSSAVTVTSCTPT